MISGRLLPLLLVLVSAAVMSAPPQLYHHAAQESPVTGEPDDLLLIPGHGFSKDDKVVYRAVRDTTKVMALPNQIPARSGPEFGVAPIVSSSDARNSLTIKLPQTLRAHQSYALWVRTARGEWSRPVLINDARPLWMSPTYMYASSSPGELPRELKIIGRNLEPSLGHATQIRLIGPQRFTEKAITEPETTHSVGEYVARVALPRRLAPGNYRIQLSRDDLSWVNLDGQMLEVLSDPPAAAEFSVSDRQFGNCRPNDGADDAACIIRAISAASRAGGGVVYFGPGTWNLIDSAQPGMNGFDGIVVPDRVQLRGAGSTLTRLERHSQWNAHGATAAFTLVGHTRVTGFTFRDTQLYQPSDQSGPYLQMGKKWQEEVSPPGGADAVVSDVTISQNIFDKPKVAISAGGLPIDRLFITYNIFGAYQSDLQLSGDQFDMVHKFRLDDSVIDYNVFNPGSELDLNGSTGPVASELGAGHRVDFSQNTADGAASEFLNSPDDAKGWRAAFFWSPNNNVEEVLVSQNTATCTGDKISDGEAIAFDNNLNTFALSSIPAVEYADAASVTISAPLATRQHDRDVPVASYYVGHWVQIVNGSGLGQVRKIIGYTTDLDAHRTTFRVAPDWDVTPVPGDSRIAIGREYWQLYVVGNLVDSRRPLCQKSNRSRRGEGSIVMWAQSADSVFARNRQYDSDGITVQQSYGFVRGANFESVEHPCADCTVMGFFNYFLEIRDNIVDGEYDWNNNCSGSGITLGVAAAPWAGVPPPIVGFGVSISHNTIRHADGLSGGAIAQMNTWLSGPEPHRWALSDNVLIHHNSIEDIDGPRASATCGPSRPRVGIVFPESAISWRTVLYANTCKNVSTPIGSGGVDTLKLCPSSTTESCECPSTQ